LRMRLHYAVPQRKASTMRRSSAILVPFVLALTACSSTSSPAATYIGGACDYDGPSEFDLDSTVTFTVENESDTAEVGFSILDFPEDLASEEILELGIFACVPFGTAEAFTGNPTAIGAPEDLTVTFDTPGQWGLTCYDESGNEHGGAGLDYVTMFTVTE